AFLGRSIAVTDEIYQIRDFDVGGSRVLLRLDPNSVDLRLPRASASLWMAAGLDAILRQRAHLLRRSGPRGSGVALSLVPADAAQRGAMGPAKGSLSLLPIAEARRLSKYLWKSA